MNRSTRYRLGVGALMLMGFICGDGAPVAHASPRRLNSGVLSPGSHPYGATYGEWSARWWQWAFSIPASNHPLFDNSGCETGQSGPVWFLGGAFTGTVTTRNCTAPSGKAIFFPVVNAECSTVEPPPFFGGNEAELRDCARLNMDLAESMSASIDGQDVTPLSIYRVQSPLYTFSYPADNIFGLPGAGSGQSVSDGVWLMLAPMSAGSHSIHFSGSIAGFLLDVTYNLTIIPAGQDHVQTADEPGNLQRMTWGTVKAMHR